MSCHVLTGDLLTRQAANIRKSIEEMLRQRFHIEHTVLQMECQECGASDIFCKLTFGRGEEKAKEPPQG